MAVPGREAWIVGETSATAQGERVILQPAVPLTVATPDGAPVTVDLAEAKGPRVVVAESQAGPPGVSFDARTSRFAPHGLSAITATASGGRAVVAWPASGSAPQEIRLTLRAASGPAAAEALQNGTAGGEVEKGASRAVELGGGRKRVAVALGEGVTGVLTRGGEALTVVAGGGPAITQTLETEADRVTLMAAEGAGHFAIEAVPLGDAPPTRVALGGAFEGDLGAGGWLQLPVAAAPGARLHVRGASGDPVFVGDDGRVVRGSDTPVRSRAPCSCRTAQGSCSPGSTPIRRRDPGRGCRPRGCAR